MLLRKSLLWFGLVVPLALASAARAEDNLARARELFRQGKTDFDLGQFDQAIAAWQEAYQYKREPLFLYNIAQAYRQSGNTQRALFFYKRYLLTAPHAPNRADVQEKIALLQEVLDEQAHAKDMPPSD